MNLRLSVYVLQFILAVLLFTNSTSFVGPTVFEGYQHNDFAHFYVSARRFFQGLPVYGVALQQDLEAAGFQNEPHIEVATNPPALVTLCGLLLLVSPLVAFWLWTSVQVILFYAAALGLLRERRGSISVLHCMQVLIGVFVTRAFISHIEYGQVQLLLGALLMAGYLLLRRQSAATASCGALLLGMTAGLKIFTWPLIFLAYQCRGTRGVGAFVIGVALVNIPALLLGGNEIFVNFFKYAVPYIQESAGIYSGNIGLPFAIFWVARAIFGIQSWAAWQDITMGGLQLLGAAGMLWFLSRRMHVQRPAYTFSACVCLSLLLAPTVWPHYLVLLVVPGIVLCSAIKTRKDTLIGVGVWALFGLMNGRTMPAAPLTQTIQILAPGLGIFALLVASCLLGRFDTNNQNEADGSH